MATERPDMPERIASVETAIQYLAQSQVQSEARFAKYQEQNDKRFDRLETKVDRILFTIIIVGAGLFAASITTAVAAIMTLMQR